MSGDWREIPGYDGAYEINFEGEVRSWRYRGERFAKKPTMLKPYCRRRRNRNRGQTNCRYVRLTSPDGKSRDVPVMHLVIEAWLGGRRPGMVPYHINGDLADNSVNNIGWTTSSELGKKYGANAKRIPVAKVTESGEVVAFYRSAREAARENHMSYQTVIDRCNGRVKRPFLLDGYNYVWDR